MRVRDLGFILIISFLLAFHIDAQPNQFTYQGSLNNGGTPATGNYDFEFALFDAPVGGSTVGTLQIRNGVAVTNGVFSVQLDFGPGVFTGPGRYLEIRVRPAGQPGITVLTPRQIVGSAPYSIRSLSADIATSANNLGGVPSNQFVVTTDPRMTDARVPIAGSGDYVQNRGTPQPGTSFNVSGNGTVGGTLSGNAVSATTQYNLGGSRLISVAGASNLFVGPGAGISNTGTGNSFFGENAGASSSGGSNAFFGSGAGQLNSTGFQNAFFGYGSGSSNTIGDDNAFYGSHAGQLNTTASDNSFFGSAAGYNNTTASENSFFGSNAGYDNTVGNRNSFFGTNAGQSNTTGDNNSFFGRLAGTANTTANSNSFFGSGAGAANTTGNSNSFFGTFAGVANSTAIDNSFFGRSAGESTTTGNYNAFFGRNAGMNNTTGFNNVFMGKNAGIDNVGGGNDTFIGNYAGENNTSGSSNSFFGSFAGNTNVTGSNNTVIGAGADVGASNLSFATAIGGGVVVNASNTVAIGRDTDTVFIPGIIKMQTFGIAANNNLCANIGAQIGLCVSSVRYKTDLETYAGGIELVRRLRPITFRWKATGEEDLGFGAEEVAAVEPRLVFRNKDGAVEGVRYNQMTAVLANAVKEQQTEIERQANLIMRLEQQIEALKKVVCASNPAADVCKE